MTRFRLTLFAVILAAVLWLDPIWAPLVPVGLFMPVFVTPPPWSCSVCTADGYAGNFLLTFSGSWRGENGATNAACATALNIAILLEPVASIQCNSGTPPSGDCFNFWEYTGTFDIGCGDQELNFTLVLSRLGSLYNGSVTICWLPDEGTNGFKYTQFGDSIANELDPFIDGDGLHCEAIDLTLNWANGGVFSPSVCWCRGNTSQFRLQAVG